MRGLIAIFAQDGILGQDDLAVERDRYADTLESDIDACIFHSRTLQASIDLLVNRFDEH